MTDELDDAIRSELQSGGLGGFGDPHHTLATLAPAMRTARRRRQAVVGSVGAVVLLVLGAGAVFTASLIGDTPADRLVTSTDPSPITTVDVDDDQPTDDDLAPEVMLPPVTTLPPPTTAPPSTTVPPAPSTVVPAAPTPSPTTAPASVQPAPTPAPAPTSSPAPATTAPPASAPSTVPASTAPPTTSPPTTAPPTTGVAPGTRTITSRCGSIRISFDATSVQLLGTSPNPGFTADVSSSGPKVDVEFGPDDDDDDSCEISAEIDDGELDIEIDD